MHWKLKTIITAVVIAGFSWNLSAADVKVTYEKECAKCHGKDGKGQTTMGKKLKVKDYTVAEGQKWTTEEGIKITKEGKKEGAKTLMKAYSPALTDAEIKELMEYIRKFKK